MDFPGVARRIYLKPGGIFLGDRPATISTLLGSCVAVTMFVRRLEAGAICHGILPSCRGNRSCAGGDLCVEGIRYVDCSIRRMYEWLRQFGVGRGEIEAKVFGGSDMFSAGEDPSRVTVGKQNIIRAFQVLDEEKLRVAASDVGGQVGRKILFSTQTGEVLLKHLQKTETEKHRADH